MKTEVGCHFLLQEIFPTQRYNQHVLNQQADSLPLTPHEKPRKRSSACKQVKLWGMYINGQRALNHSDTLELGTKELPPRAPRCWGFLWPYERGQWPGSSLGSPYSIMPSCGILLHHRAHLLYGWDAHVHGPGPGKCWVLSFPLCLSLLYDTRLNISRWHVLIARYVYILN